jgi:hypothetical protein
MPFDPVSQTISEGDPVTGLEPEEEDEAMEEGEAIEREPELGGEQGDMDAQLDEDVEPGAPFREEEDEQELVAEKKLTGYVLVYECEGTEGAEVFVQGGLKNPSVCHARTEALAREALVKRLQEGKPDMDLSQYTFVAVPASFWRPKTPKVEVQTSLTWE